MIYSWLLFFFLSHGYIMYCDFSQGNPSSITTSCQQPVNINNNNQSSVINNKLNNKINTIGCFSFALIWITLKWSRRPLMVIGFEGAKMPCTSLLPLLQSSSAGGGTTERQYWPEGLNDHSVRREESYVTHKHPPQCSVWNLRRHRAVKRPTWPSFLLPLAHTRTRFFLF